MSSINSRVPPLRLAAVDSPSDGQVASYQASSGQFEWVDTSSVSPGGTSGSIQYNDGAGGFTGSTKMIYDDTDAKITLTTGGNTLFIDAGGSPQLSFDGTGTGNIPTIAGDGGEAGGTGLLFLGNNTVSNNYMWFNKGSDQIQIIAPSASESIKINSNLGGNIEITATGGSQDVILSAATGNVKIEGLSYPTSDGTINQVLKTDGSGVLSFTDAATGTVSSVGTSQAFITIADPTTTPSISIGNASASATGVLTATDWNTFNNKGSGTVTSVGLTETGSALTITGSPITGSGTLNIAGAGTSSQVILGDLSLGTLTSGTVTGTGSANQVSYWTSTTAQAGSTGLTYNPSTGDLTVGGYVETGTKVTTPSGTNLELSPGGASSGSIVIADGVNGQISLNPNGTGTVKLDGVNIDNSAIATGYVLKATSATAAGWADAGGGGGIYQAFSGIKPVKPNSAIYDEICLMQMPYGLYQNDATGGTVAESRPIYTPFVLPSDLTITDLIIEVTNAGSAVGTNMVVGIYDTDSDGYPSTQLFTSTFAVGSGTSNGPKIVGITNTGGTGSLNGGEIYYIGSCLSQADSPQLKRSDDGTAATGGLIGSNNAVNQAVMNSTAIRDNTATQYTLPTTVTVTTGSNWQPFNIDLLTVGAVLS